MRYLVLLLLASAGIAIPATEPRSDGIRDLAVRLAANRVAAGVISPEQAFTGFGSPPKQDPRGQEIFRAELPAILGEFERANPSFVARSVSGVVVVVRRDQPTLVTEFLARSVIVPGLHETNARDAIFKHLAARLHNTPLSGLIGSGPVPKASCPLDATVTFGQVSHSVMTFLNHVVQQVPGLVWTVIYDSDDHSKISLGVVCPDGASFRTEIQ